MWKDVVGYEGLYRVSNTGQIFSVKRGIIRKTKLSVQGYPVLALSNKGVSKTVKVHRLVAQAFIDNPDNKSYVNHKDGNRKNPNSCNLEWVTPRENLIHARDYLKGSPSQKLSLEQVKEIRHKFTGKWGELVKLAKEYNVTSACISAIRRGKTFT